MKRSPLQQRLRLKIHGLMLFLPLDVSRLKDEAGFLKPGRNLLQPWWLMKKREAAKNYKGRYLDYLKIYTKLLTATT